MNKLLVVIVTYNGMRWIDRCLSSVIESIVSADIFIVDNGSADGTIEHIKTEYPSVKLIESNSNLGFGKANNIGFRYALSESYDYVYLLNQDAWVSPDTFSTLINENKLNREYGILSPIQINASEELDRNFANCCPRQLLSDFFRGNVKTIYQVPEVMAAHWMISRDCIEKVGGFSPAFPHYGEDNNYIQRAKLHGFKTGIVTTTKAIHDRENRQLTKLQIIYRQYIEAIVEFSNPLIEVSVVRILLWDFLKNSFTLKSFLPFRYMWKFIIHKSRLSKYKTRSISQGVFL